MNIPRLQQAIVAGSLLASNEIQGQTHQKMIEILLPKASPVCTKQTKLIIPEWSNWWSLLKNFQTCTQDMTIRVLEDGTLKINDGTSTWIWELKKDNTAIQPIYKKS